MNDVTTLLNAAHQGDRQAAEQLLPLVYDELRRLAAARLANERSGHTLEATALVHEAYLRLVPEADPDRVHPHSGFANRRHFFAAAAQAMQRILVDSARRRRSLKRGGDQPQENINELDFALPEPREDLIALDEALQRLEQVEPQAAQLVQLRFFLGHSLLDAAEIMGVSPRTAYRLWAYARAWLHRELTKD
jgi:RNA polymerase sigma factor (TIGR02999 family)